MELGKIIIGLLTSLFSFLTIPFSLNSHVNEPCSLSKLIIQAILHNKSLATLISDFNISQNNSNWLKLEELMKHNYKVAFLKATMNSDLTDYLGEYYDD